MNSYILLRDNKESAALSLDDLRQLGLKPNDLVWVEGQSASWRNPHEIRELKDLVNISPSKQADDAVKPGNSLQETKSADNPKKKLVYVELPAEAPIESQPVPIKEDTEQVKETSQPAGNGLNAMTTSGLNDYYFKKYNGQAPAGKKAVTGDSVELDTKYSRPLDEIKEMYVKNMEEQKKRPGRITSFQLPARVKKIAFYSGLVLSGAIIMLLIQNTGAKKPIAVVNASHQPATQMPVNDSEEENATTYSPVVPVNTTNSSPAGESKSSVTSNEGLPDMAKPLPEPEKKAEPVAEAATEIQEEQNTKEVIANKPVSKETLSSMVSVKANDYAIGSFGGIRNLEMTLQNDSKYLLDHVTVELRYLSPEGAVVKTENIRFESVNPGATETMAVKKTRRGVKVSYKILRIEPRETGASTSSL